jgi:hypothetical protein
MPPIFSMPCSLFEIIIFSPINSENKYIFDGWNFSLDFVIIWKVISCKITIAFSSKKGKTSIILIRFFWLEN